MLSPKQILSSIGTKYILRDNCFINYSLLILHPFFKIITSAPLIKNPTWHFQFVQSLSVYDFINVIKYISNEARKKTTELLA